MMPNDHYFDSPLVYLINDMKWKIDKIRPPKLGACQRRKVLRVCLDLCNHGNEFIEESICQMRACFSFVISDYLARIFRS